MNPNLLGIDRLAVLENGDALKGFWVGKVVDDGEKDAQGRITARIEALFGDAKTGIPDADLPKLMMMPSCGLYARPQKDDFVTVVFQGSVYEGFYVGHTVSAKSKVFDADLGKEFVLNFHNSFIKGKYDGSKFELDVCADGKKDGCEFEINVNKGKSKIKMDGKGNLDITGDNDIKVNAKGTVNIHGNGKVVLEHTGTGVPSPNGALCAVPNCLFTGAPHRSDTALG